MAMTVHVDLVSAEELIYSGRAEMVVASGVDGDLGITPGHAPLVTPLAPGPVKIVKQDHEPEYYYVSGGTLEVQPDVVTVLADTALRAHDLDEAEAEKAKLEAEQAMSKHSSDMDYSAAQADLMRAIAQLRAIKQLRSKK